MTEQPLKIKNIINLEDYIKNEEEYKHLFEVQLPPEGLRLFRIRENINMGTPLVGDLVLDLEAEDTLEIHPFPEWVVYLKSIGNNTSKPYLIIPNLSKPFVKKLNRKSVQERIDLIKNQLIDLKIEDLLAFEYEIGINILVPAFLPHFFISSKINKDQGESPPFLQVFEPKMDFLTKNLKIKTTYFFKMPFSVMI